MSRARLLSQLRSLHGVQNDTELMNSLQDHGLVSDNAETLDDCADGDLVRALNQEVTNL